MDRHQVLGLARYMVIKWALRVIKLLRWNTEAIARISVSSSCILCRIWRSICVSLSKSPRSLFRSALFAAYANLSRS